MNGELLTESLVQVAAPLGKKIGIEEYDRLGKFVKLDATTPEVVPKVPIGGAEKPSSSVVVKSVAPYSIVGGNPAKVIGERRRDLRYSTETYWLLH